MIIDTVSPAGFPPHIWFFRADYLSAVDFSAGQLASSASLFLLRETMHLLRRPGEERLVTIAAAQWQTSHFLTRQIPLRDGDLRSSHKRNEGETERGERPPTDQQAGTLKLLPPRSTVGGGGRRHRPSA